MESKNLTKTFSKSDLVRKSSFRIDNLSYDDRLNLIDLKKKLAEKVFRDLNKKFFKLIRDKKFELNSIISDFEKEMSRSYDFKNPNYNTFLKKIEKIFLDRINLYNDKNAFNDANYNLDIKYHNKNSIPDPCKSISLDNTKTFCYGKGFSNKNLNFYHKESNKATFVKSQIENLYHPIKENFLRKEKDASSKTVHLNLTGKVQLKQIHPGKLIASRKIEYSKKLTNEFKEKEITRRKSLNNIEYRNRKEGMFGSERENDDLGLVQSLRRRWLEDKLALFKQD